MKEIVEDTIYNFIKKMGYLENRHVIGILFYGSYLTGYNHSKSDIDLHVVFDNLNPGHLIRGNEYVNGIRIEYFEKPLREIYESIDNDYEDRNNAWLPIIGKSRIILDRVGAMEALQEYTVKKFSKPLPPIASERAREKVSILDNRMEKLEIAVEKNDPAFTHLYHLTIEKIRKFYHELKGLPKVSTTKVKRIYEDETYRKSFDKEEIPEQEFITMYLNLIEDEVSDKKTKYENIKCFYEYATRDVKLDRRSYRILIESRNNPNFRHWG